MNLNELDQRIAQQLIDRMRANLSGGLEAIAEELSHIRSLWKRRAIPQTTFRMALEVALLVPEVPEDDRVQIEEELKGSFELVKDEGSLSEMEEDSIRKRIDKDVAWHLPPPFKSDWEVLSDDALVDFTKKVAAGLLVSWQHDVVSDLMFVRSGRSTPLAFWPEARFVEIITKKGDFRARSILGVEVKDSVELLNGTSPPIHKLNSSNKLDFTSFEKVESYLRFFCGLVHGDAGPFRIVGDRREFELYAEAEAIRDAQANSETKVPEQELLIEPDGDGVWTARTQVLYGGVLFASTLKIPPNGIVEMESDDHLLSGFKCLQERFVGFWRVVSSL